MRSMKCRVFICLCAGIFLTTGCEPLRKKFVRKKKKETETKFVPVLEPIDYPTQKYSAERMYGYHYSMSLVWARDLEQAIEEKNSGKRQEYILDQLIVQMGEMMVLLSQDKAQELKILMDCANKIKNEYKNPPALRNTTRVRSQLKTISRSLHREFKENQVKDRLK